ncbi:MAG: hypothetical protein A2600_03335 [Candidatus Lambdaproteobacteria bacterium RIFOXYD1_FULL_56_27]|uniref:Uncharacterized protein n=1 Tax=Candidatus Lambdaproteobacteria bacterium RIFOXYD2_FULL_56_26 TaxID=1817773 RepID=A0A1F6H336_9PROT|nr:MAG: hypothetical protein A2426_11395 [Candidatus Lambdaproteobacteria bacterium RIFOXYC1_FULL_56_13]OGH04803.1 MAG: hypothetical protein A2557_07400 [Candidatus Lambdaproteobacteria bacterium RIFOXYD2_FULL_56_26]OGH09268.1 MAG: hypothetical protein A2600_03335 [Candidatus Lambdaproteobacteria bacterium RIFOXYD1_FULL_56_27]
MNRIACLSGGDRKGLLVALVLLFFTAAPAFALIGERPAAPYEKVVPYRGAFTCYGKWTTVKRQRIAEDGSSVPHMGYRCVDDKKIRRDMVEGKPQ